MKTSLMALLIGLFGFGVIGCGNSDNNLGTPDLSAGGGDLSVANDLAASGPDLAKLSCYGVLNCFSGCTAQNLNTCAPACIAQLSDTGKPYFNALQACAQPACYAPDDAGTSSCDDPASQMCLGCIETECPNEVQNCINN